MPDTFRDWFACSSAAATACPHVVSARLVRGAPSLFQSRISCKITLLGRSQLPAERVALANQCWQIPQPPRQQKPCCIQHLPAGPLFHGNCWVGWRCAGEADCQHRHCRVCGTARLEACVAESRRNLAVWFECLLACSNCTPTCRLACGCCGGWPGLARVGQTANKRPSLPTARTWVQRSIYKDRLIVLGGMLYEQKQYLAAGQAPTHTI